MYSPDDEYRFYEIISDDSRPHEAYRSAWRRDFARLIHSPSFRRLQGKTQLFPGEESDFFRNRMTHSLEVAQIGKSVAFKLNQDLEDNGEKLKINPDIVEFAGMAHDLGHPPFGHFGEQALDKRMRSFGGFEGNAQTLRIIARLEKKEFDKGRELGINNRGNDKRVGLNLAVRSMASILKYDNEIPKKDRFREEIIKGYYHSENDVVELIKNKVCSGKNIKGKFKTVECQIMDFADDIAYSTYDLEDSFKAGFIKPIDFLTAPKEIIRKVRDKVNNNTQSRLSDDDIREKLHAIFFEVVSLPEFRIENKRLTKHLIDLIYHSAYQIVYQRSKEQSENGFLRTRFTSKLVGSYIRSIKMEKINREHPALSIVSFEKEKRIEVEILKHFIFESQILSPKIQIAALRSREIIERIFDTLCKENGHLLLPPDFQAIFQRLETLEEKKRTICDFISGMTDNYALEFYGRLTSEHPQTIFKPIH